MRTLLKITTAFLLSSTVQAAEFITLPMPSELLKEPIELSCGAVIREWRGSSINASRINNICSLAHREFLPFVHGLGYKTNQKPFKYSISFIPASSNYRDLNDTIYRFPNREPDLTGYTVHEGRYVFNTSDTKDIEFNVSLLHEFFHAMSYHYGVFDQYYGSINEKKHKDEVLAKKFTKKIIGRE